MGNIKNIIKVSWVVIIIAFMIINLNAQSDSISINNRSHKEIGLNFTQFVSQFVPLNLKNVKDGPIGYSFKYYNDRDFALRFGFGANINKEFENSFLSIRLGYEKRRQLSEKFFFTRGWDVLALVGGFNLPSKQENGGAIGLGPVIGLEYHITDKLIFTTESMLFVGISSNTGFDVSILPPTAFFIHFRF